MAGNSNSGRRPAPSSILKLRGGFKRNPSRENKSEPKAPSGRPRCPKHLKGVARREWDTMCKVLASLNILHTTDRSALEQYCKAYGAWRDAWEKVEKLGQAIPSKMSDGTIRLRRNPYELIAQDNARLILKFLQEFGLTPSSRSRVEAFPVAADVNPLTAIAKRG